MSEFESLKSYLVDLSFDVSGTSLGQFNQVMGQAGQTVGKFTDFSGKALGTFQAKIGSSIGSLSKIVPPQVGALTMAMRDSAKAIELGTGSLIQTVVGWQAGISGAFLGIGASVIGFADKVAQSDLALHNFAMTTFMSEASAKRYKTALDALGQPLENVIWNPELRARFQQLEADQTAMLAKLGPAYEANMEKIRDFHQEVTRFQVGLEYLGQRVVSSLVTAFGPELDGLLGKLNDFVTWFDQNFDVIGDKIAKFLVPILKDGFQIFKALAGAAEEFGVLFTNVIGLLTGDKSIQGTEFSFSNLATAVQHVVHDLALFVQWITLTERMLVHFANAAVLAISFDFSGALKELKAGLGDITKETATIVAGTVGFAVAGPGGAAVLSTVAGGALGYAREKLAPGLENKADTAPLRATQANAVGAPQPNTPAAQSTTGGSFLDQLKTAFSFGPATPKSSSTASTGSSTATSSKADSPEVAARVEQAKSVAAAVSQKTGLDPAEVFGQMAFETGGFTKIAATNNFAGIKDPATQQFKAFNSLDEFEEKYAHVLSLTRYQKAGLPQAKTNQEYADALYRGGYSTTGDAASYAAGMERYEKQYGMAPGTGGNAGGNTVNVDHSVTMGDITVHVTQPNASAEEIATTVNAKIRESMNRQTQIDLAQLQMQAAHS